MLDNTVSLTLAHTVHTLRQMHTHIHLAQPELKVNSSTGRIAYHLSYLSPRGMTSQTSERRSEKDKEKVDRWTGGRRGNRRQAAAREGANRDAERRRQGGG